MTMAWATKCDRCGKYFGQREQANGFAFLVYDRSKDKYCMEGEEYDLCPGCVQDLCDWFDRKKGSKS
jgi:hypothetical protein